MWNEIQTIVGSLLVLAGAIFALSGSLGILRFPHFFARLHPAGIADSLATLLVIAGLIISIGWEISSLKLVLLLLFLMFTNPTACYALAKAAWLDDKMRKEAGADHIYSRTDPLPDSVDKKEEN
jgi:multicomponent Na+:H+ antiporter subunit G